MAEELEVVPGPEQPAESLEAQLSAATSGGNEGEPAPTQVPGPAEAPATAAEWQGVRDAARAMGVELPFEDDSSALGGLVQAYQQSRQRNYFAELGQRIAPHAAQVQDFLKQRQAPAPAERPAWSPPEFRKEWLNVVERDEQTGQLRAKAGYDPSLADKVQAYAEWRDRFLESPETVVAPLVEQRAQALIDARFAAHAEQAEAERILAARAAVLYQRDAQGRPLADRAGRPMYSPEGVVYAQTVQALAAKGLNDPRTTDAVASMAVELTTLRRQLAATASSPSTPAALTATGSPPVGGGTARPAPGVVQAPASHKGRNLREMLQANLGAFNDADAGLN